MTHDQIVEKISELRKKLVDSKTPEQFCPIIKEINELAQRLVDEKR